MGVLPHLSVVRKRDEAQHGEYRTVRVILAIYDRMAEATHSGVPNAALLDPPPADQKKCVDSDRPSKTPPFSLQ